ncbi:hypothetical protein EW145_g8053 [Phellinidium pouzarii]|uniref:Uncharacterized protein n=1 Tax=Phellinidium pouzarii TaxID=167371 RepID=A0A4S4KAD0_9AGAM|nr:hypothetical protein EW145_g8053 [Phellinidium pouzarii]
MRAGGRRRGARGVLASTLRDAHAAVDTMLSDLLPLPLQTQTGAVSPPSSVGVLHGEVEDVLLNADADMGSVPREVVAAMAERLVMNYDDWKKVDEEEQRRGKEKGKERERMLWDEARKFISSSP